jgi:hypothetical protein
MVVGLGRAGLHQRFDSKPEAMDAYLQAREKGLVQVIRQAGDSDADYGDATMAEDL